MLNKSSNINDKSGNRLYTSDKGEVVLISDDRNSNIEINPDRITPSNVANPIPGSYDYTFKGYVNKNDVNIINNQKASVPGCEEPWLFCLSFSRDNAHSVKRFS